MVKTLNIKGELLELSQPIVMGILNITPDSFYENSRNPGVSQALKRVEQILSEGGAIIDIGAQSTRPTSDFLSAEEEIARLKPVLDAVRQEFGDIVLSIDTFHSEVARFCVEEYGVDIINDISGGEIDKNMFETVAELNVPYILMHMRGTPQTMQQMTDYDNFLQEVFFYFSEKVAQLHLLGVNDIILDPGFGFSKNLKQNYELFKNLSFFKNFDLPLLVGVSRKSMITRLLDIQAAEALNGTTALNTLALMSGADILRVHDVKEAVETIKITNELKDTSN